MDYRAVGNRCAVNLIKLQTVASNQELIVLLQKADFNILTVDIVELARSVVGKSQYRRGAKPSEAPSIFDCSSLIKWLYGQCGVWLPRRSIQQREMGERIQADNLSAGDVIYVSGYIDYYTDDPTDGVGHVGIYTGAGTVIHAANRRVGVIESELSTFCTTKNFRGARRFVPRDNSVIILETPLHREVETEDDVLWILRIRSPR